MGRRRKKRQGFGETAETIYFVLLPFLCFAALLRSCGAKSAEITEVVQESDSGQTEAAAPTEETEEEGESEETRKQPAVRRNPYDPDSFYYLDDESGRITYQDENYEAVQGIDVSEHQGEIDWDAVADAGYEFVFVRVGFRGYGAEGTLNEDTMAIDYMQDAEEAGLMVGAYFFSQAVNEAEAAEEARFAAEIIKRSGVRLDLPLVYDPETAGGSVGRANDLSREQVSRNAQAFKEAAESELHCKTALYSNLYWENNYFEKETLNQFEIWYADYEDTPQTPYHFTWWQYTETGTVPGIEGNMDLNLWIRQTD